MRTTRASRAGRAGRESRTPRGELTPTSQNRVRLSALRAGPPTRLEALRVPPGIAADYARRLRAIAKDAWKIADKTVGAAVRRHAKVERGDADQPDLPLDIEDAQNRMEEELRRYEITLTPAAALPVGSAVEQAVRGYAVRLSTSLGVRPIAPDDQVLSGARDRWVEENAALIRSQPAEIAERIGVKVQQAVERGSRWETLSASLQGELGIAERRANLIARDQVSKYASSLNQAWQTSVGITHYEWRGAMDARERPEHVALQGMVFAWDRPSPLGHPGEPIQCRCTAQPVVSAQQINRPQPEVTEEWLVARTIELGPKARDVGKPAEKLAQLAASSVRSEIRLAQNRAAILANRPR